MGNFIKRKTRRQRRAGEAKRAAGDAKRDAELRELIRNAPEGATRYDENGEADHWIPISAPDAAEQEILHIVEIGDSFATFRITIRPAELES